ncbi:hypothetical protein BRO54_1746 [Geobacillus proteiniphilus]|uniref:DUF4183 domain-containing protein n=1 Tax=Geobacillus proteiniphilus TaxID=860353 RepID=A0A1Q5T1I2_9BACL|nr:MULTISPECIES: DUF4183 domain-containing protein [Geobacillus]ADI26753.1 hypothetical protein GC56T3_1756 [Geobacillus sp. C56-T3]OKO94131.1 hypothetical protein BRO54_1746 [Geobacillus proteiniphilus]OPX02252.1 hypothetical protein B1A75_13625 [Geobacillus sp. LEMMY01]
MALQLIKLFVAATTTTEVAPDVARFFYITTAEIAEGATLTIDAASFLQDDGSQATELPALATNNSYFNVYINGVLQMEGISTYTPGATGVGSLSITVPTGSGSIPANTPVVLEIVQFAPSSNTTVTT